MGTTKVSVAPNPALGAALAFAERGIATTDRLRVGLLQLGLGLVAAELGKTPSGLAWILTVEFPGQRVVNRLVQLRGDQDPHGPDVCEFVVQQFAEATAAHESANAAPKHIEKEHRIWRDYLRTLEPTHAQALRAFDRVESQMYAVFRLQFAPAITTPSDDRSLSLVWSSAYEMFEISFYPTYIDWFYRMRLPHAPAPYGFHDGNCQADEDVAGGPETLLNCRAFPHVLHLALEKKVP